MKRTITLLSLLSLGVACAATPAQLNADLVYTMIANGINPTTQDFNLSFTIDSISKVNDSQYLVNLGGNYGMFGQYNTASQQYIGMRLNGQDKANYNEVNTPASGGTPATNTYTVKPGTTAAAGVPADKVVGWVTHNASGSQAHTNFAGASVSISSTSATASEISITTSSVKNVVQNNAGITLMDVQFANEQMSVSDVAITSGGNTYTMEMTDLITGRPLTNTVSGNLYGGSMAFNFGITSQDDLVDGGVIAAYFSNIASTSAYSANAFTLKEQDGQFYLAAGDGHFSSNDKTDPGTFTVDDGRTVTLTGVALEVGKEYTVLVVGANQSQHIYLYDGKTYLTDGSYNGNMAGAPGGFPVGSTMEVYNSAVYTPEPATATLSLLALAALASRRRRH